MLACSFIASRVDAHGMAFWNRVFDGECGRLEGALEHSASSLDSSLSERVHLLTRSEALKQAAYGKLAFIASR